MKKLLLLATEKGFESKCKIDCFNSGLNESDIIKLDYYLWMCELQKWLRDKHNIHISLFTDLEDGNIEYYCDVFTIDRKNLNCEYSGLKYTYEQSLEIGLYESLKLIK